MIDRGQIKFGKYIFQNLVEVSKLTNIDRLLTSLVSLFILDLLIPFNIMIALMAITSLCMDERIETPVITKKVDPTLTGEGINTLADQ